MKHFAILVALLVAGCSPKVPVSTVHLPPAPIPSTIVSDPTMEQETSLMKEAVELQTLCIDTMSSIDAKRVTKEDYCSCAIGQVIRNMRARGFYTHADWQAHDEELAPSRGFMARCALNSLRMNETPDQ